MERFKKKYHQTIVERRIYTIITKTKFILFLTLLILILAYTWNFAEAYYPDVQLLELSPSSGSKGTIINVSMDVKGYFIGKGGSYQGYLGLKYLLVWDPLGPDNSYSVGNLLSPRNLKQIGTATIGYDGILTGSAEIPWEGSTSGVHNIYAVFEQNSASNYKEWWWATFNYQADSGSTDSYSLTVYTTDGGYVDKYPDQSYYDYGSSVTLTAHAYSGWQFNGWSGDVSGTSESILIKITENMQVTATFIESSGNGDGGSEGGNGPCIIATATFGSYFAPEVTFMRRVRDDLIGSNDIGKVLVKSWNTFYYSWSPPIARIIASSDQLRTISSILLTPLLGTMHVVALQYNLIAPVNQELASIMSFATAAILSTTIYIAFPIWLTYSLLKPKSWLEQPKKKK